MIYFYVFTLGAAVSAFAICMYFYMEVSDKETANLIVGLAIGAAAYSVVGLGNMDTQPEAPLTNEEIHDIINTNDQPKEININE